MKSTLLLLALAVTACLSADVKEEDNVLVLNADNFDEVIEGNSYVLVEFYAPWCGHCKALAGPYAEAATTLKDSGSEVKLAKVDATEEGDLASQFGVRGYPTLKFFKNGKETDYNGGRTAKDIIAWVTKRTGPPAVPLESVDDTNSFIEKNEVSVIGFFTDSESENVKIYTNAADSQDSLSFGIVTDKEVIEGMEAAANTVVLYKKTDKAVYEEENFNAEDIVNFVLLEQLELVTKFTDETAPKIFGGNQQNHLLCFFSGEADDYDSIMEALRGEAKKFKGKILFVHIDMAEDSALRVADFFNIGDDDYPTCRLINLEADMKKFVPDFEGIVPEKLGPWVQSYLDGNLQAHLNTEEVPEDWNENPVVVLVGKNFKEIALDDTKDVFVEFYAPWCGHCKQLAPIWEDLGEHFKDDENVIIAKMDSTKNEIEEVQVQGFPTLKFFKSGTNEILDYNGERTLDALIEFVETTVSGESSDAGDADDADDADDTGDTDDTAPVEDEAEEVKKDEL